MGKQSSESQSNDTSTANGWSHETASAKQSASSPTAPLPVATEGAWNPTPDHGASPLATILLEAAARFVDLPADQFDEVIGQTVEQLAAHIQMEHVGLSLIKEVQGQEGQAQAVVTRRYVAGQIYLPSADELAFPYPWYTAQLRAGSLIILPNGVDNLPPEAEAERAYGLAQGLKCSLVIPLRIGEQWIGTLYFNSTTRFYQWPSPDLHALTLFARVLAGAAQRKQANDVLRHNEEQVEQQRQELLRHARIMEQTERLGQIGGWEWDLANDAVYWTPETYHIFGVSPTEHTPTFTSSLNFFTPASATILKNAIRRATEAGESYELKLQIINAQGKTRWVRLSGCIEIVEGQVVHLYGSIQDITIRTEIEEQLREAQKMEAIGQLAGGIAHDFNNMLTAINGMSELAILYLERAPAATQSDRIRYYLGEIQRAGRRAAELTRQLLAFSRKQVLQPKVLDLRAQVMKAQSLLQQILGEKIELALMMPSHVGLVLADPSQVEQALINLVINARDAMPNGGTLTIRLSNINIDEPTARQQLRLQPGNYVVLEVQDNGNGMTPEVQARLFDPFFTTKVVGAGSGLGLATVYGIVKQSGGIVEVESQLSVGSTFRIFLPQSNPSPQASQSPVNYVRGGTETILIVDDDDLTRSTIRTALEAKGYRVLESAGGRGAVVLCQSYVGPIHLLVTKAMMKEMGGIALANQSLLSRPEARVLLLLERGEEMGAAPASVQSAYFSLKKPYSLDILAAKVRSVLDAPDSMALL